MSAVFVRDVDLPFKAFALTLDGNWTLKAAFATEALAGAWALGVQATQIKIGRIVRILEETKKGDKDVTDRAMDLAKVAFERGR